LYPIIFKFGPLTIYSFGVLMALGFYFGALAAVTEFKRRGGDPDPMWNLLVWIFVAGLGAAYILTRRYGIRFGTLVECAAPGLAIGQAIGRIGCHVAGDGDWGVPTSLPWGVAYTNAIVGWDYPPGVRVHPTPLYEAAAYTLLFLVLWGIRKRDHPDGTIFCVYLLGASVARFFVEFLRVNPKIALGLSQAQWIAMALFAAGTLWLLRSRARLSTFERGTS
jgi:phosphatidylglycerol:prolipoprotein diacylglycerol transferase